MEKGRGGKGEESGGEEDGREGEEGRKVEKKTLHQFLPTPRPVYTLNYKVRGVWVW